MTLCSRALRRGGLAVVADLPADPPFASVSVQPHVGWTAELARETPPEPVHVGEFALDEIATAVTWTADNGVRIGPGESDEFAISVGLLPAAGDYTLPAEHTYGDGEVVPWVDEPDGELPAPVLTVVNAPGQGSAATSDERAEAKAERNAERQAARAAADDGSEGTTGADGTGTNDALARGLAVGALAVGAVGLGIGAVSLRRSRV